MTISGVFEPKYISPFGSERLKRQVQIKNPAMPESNGEVLELKHTKAKKTAKLIGGIALFTAGILALVKGKGKIKNILGKAKTSDKIKNINIKESIGKGFSSIKNKISNLPKRK